MHSYTLSTWTVSAALCSAMALDTKLQITKVSGGCKLPDPQCESLNLPCDLTTCGGCLLTVHQVWLQKVPEYRRCMTGRCMVMKHLLTLFGANQSIQQFRRYGTESGADWFMQIMNISDGASWSVLCCCQAHIRMIRSSHRECRHHPACTAGYQTMQSTYCPCNKRSGHYPIVWGFRSLHSVVMFSQALDQSTVWYCGDDPFLARKDHGWRFDKSFPICKFVYHSVCVKVRVHQFHSFRSRSTVVQWAEIIVDKHSLTSCVWPCFPDGFPHFAWQHNQPILTSVGQACRCV